MLRAASVSSLAESAHSVSLESSPRRPPLQVSSSFRDDNLFQIFEMSLNLIDRVTNKSVSVADPLAVRGLVAWLNGSG